MPRNSDFPDYKGIQVEHQNDWNAQDYHNQSFNKKEKLHREAPTKMKGVFRVPPKGSTDNKSLYEHQRDEAIQRAAAEDWRTRGLSNNNIIDY
jgi:hypothetical protein